MSEKLRFEPIGHRASPGEPEVQTAVASEPTRAQMRALSGQERDRQKHVRDAQQTGIDERPARLTNRDTVPRVGSRPGASRGGWTTARALEIVKTLGERSYADALAATKSGDRKNYATSVAIMLDKWTIVSGRPTQIIAFSADTARPGALELASRLAAVAS